MKEYFEKLSPERSSDLEIPNTMNCVNSFTDSFSGHFSEQNLYITRFGRIPNLINIEDINFQKTNDWFTKTYQDKIANKCYYRSYFAACKDIREHVCYFLFDDLLITINSHIDRGRVKLGIVTILYQKTDNALVYALVKEIRKFQKKNNEQSQIKLLVSQNGTFSTKIMEISKPKFSIEDNYNDDFVPVHQTIMSRLRKKNDKGLVLLHGKPGTGKTSYIRYLITKTRKPVIFLPPSMAASITDPGLMNVLIDNPNSVFVIEDAENIIIDRNRSGSSSVSALLNLADGLLSDCLNIQIICSFNTDLSRVDSALTRKGRLIAKYEFTELDVPKAQALSNKLGFSNIIASPMTLAAVYNQHETEFVAMAQRRSIGFNIAV